MQGFTVDNGVGRRSCCGRFQIGIPIVVPKVGWYCVVSSMCGGGAFTRIYTPLRQPTTVFIC